MTKYMEAICIRITIEGDDYVASLRNSTEDHSVNEHIIINSNEALKGNKKKYILDSVNEYIDKHLKEV